jgi:MFS family permease
MQHDWNQREISPRDITISMKTSILAGALSILWMVTTTPQQILTVLVKNHLGASSTQLGFLVGAVNLAAVMNLLSIHISKKLKGRRKRFFIINTLIQRCMAFGIAWASFHIASGGSRQEGVFLVIASAIAAAIFGNSSSSMWWSWMADLIPEQKRAVFFGKRSSIIQIVNLVFFFGATFVIDLYFHKLFLVYGILYTIAGIAGVADILLHIRIPEPKAEEATGFSREEFLKPVKDPQFRRFCLIMGFYLFSVNLAAPFLAPYITDPEGGGAPTVWLGITFVISQLAWVAMAPFWGVLMDRMGKKPVVTIGGLFIISWTGYLFLSPDNYHIVLPLIAFLGGLLAPAFWEGISQFMLALSPEESRTSYSAWYWTAFGVSAAASPLIGGSLYDMLRENPLYLAGQEISPFQVLVSISIILVLFSLTHMGRISRSEDKSVRTVVSTIMNPGIFRAISNIGILSRPTRAVNVERALREVRGTAHSLSFSEIVIRLDDPEVEVREAAALALARLGSREAEEELLRRLSETDTLSRPIIARALGSMGSVRAVPHLIDALQDRSEELQVEAAAALGKIRIEESSEPILRSLREGSTLRVRISSAEAAARMGIQAAADEIFSLLHSTSNWILRRQLAIAMGDLFGVPGEIYHYMTGEFSRNAQMIYRLAGGVERLSAGLVRRSNHGIPPGQMKTGDDIREIKNLVQSAAASFDRKEFDRGVVILSALWKKLENRLPEAPLIRWYWEKVADHSSKGGILTAQDFILGLYSIYRLLRQAGMKQR